MRRKKGIIVAIVFATIIIIAVIAILEIKARSAVKEDVETKIVYMNQGNLNWTMFSDFDVSTEIIAAINGYNSENDSLSTRFISSNGVLYSVGIAFPWSCEVTYYFYGYSFEDFVKYCEANNVKDYAEMIDSFEKFTDEAGRTLYSEAKIKYKLKNFKWVADYNNDEFLNNASCGILNQYSDYYSQSVMNIQKYIEEVENGN